MEERRSFTAEELALAKSVDLTAVAASLGYTVKKIGRYHTLKEMDSIRIYNRTNWFRWSREHERGNNGGSQIDFLRVFAGMEVKDAVFWLLDFSGYRRDGDWEKKSASVYVEKKEGRHSTEEKKKPFVLPARAKNNDYLYSYLTGDRALDRHTVDYFVSCGLIYEERSHHNIVFKGNDVQGKTRFASMRGVFDREGNPAEPDIHDIGILASCDPVAIDQASIDLAFAAEGSESLQNRVNDRNGLHTLEHAQEIGLGSRTYELVDIND